MASTGKKFNTVVYADDIFTFAKYMDMKTAVRRVEQQAAEIVEILRKKSNLEIALKKSEFIIFRKKKGMEYISINVGR